MKKGIYGMMVCMMLFALCGCSNDKKEEAAQWDCTVVSVAESKEESYIITYCDEEIVSNTGELTFQNRNDFPIVVHLIKDGKEEVFEVQAGGNVTFMQIDKEAVYTIGVHADVEEKTEIKLMVYDGDRSEVIF